MQKLWLWTKAGSGRKKNKDGDGELRSRVNEEWWLQKKLTRSDVEKEL